jgi:hypothetical protein
MKINFLMMLICFLSAALIFSCQKEQKHEPDPPVETHDVDKTVDKTPKKSEKGQVIASYFAAPGDLIGCSCSYTAKFEGDPGQILFAFTYGKSEMMKNLAYMELDGEFRTIPMTGFKNYRGQVIYTFEGGGYKVQAAVKNTSISGKDPEVMSSEATVRVETIDNRPAWLANIKGTCGC